MEPITGKALVICKMKQSQVSHNKIKKCMRLEKVSLLGEPLYDIHEKVCGCYNTKNYLSSLNCLTVPNRFLLFLTNEFFLLIQNNFLSCNKLLNQ